MTQPLTAPYSYFTDANGAPLAGGKVYTYAAGTTTPKDSYTDYTGVTVAANPVILDSAGRAAIWLNGSYKITVTDANNVSIMTEDSIIASTATGDMSTSVYDGANIQEQLAGLTAVQTISNKTLTNCTFTGVFFNAITGCLPTSVSGSNTTAAIAVSSGLATDSTNTTNIVSAGYSWAAANGNAANGTDAVSSTLSNSTTYHMYLCKGPSGVCTYASSNLNPAGPIGYQAYKRRIFSFLTNSSGTPIPFTAFESEGGSYTLYYSTVIQDVNAQTLTSTQAAITVSAPLGIITKYLGRVYNSDTSNYVIITSPQEANTLPTSHFADVASIALAPSIAKFEAETNISQQLDGRASGTATTAVSVWARGYKDYRRA